MTLVKVGGVWKPRWNAAAIGAGFTDLALTLDEDARLEAFIARHEGTIQERREKWNEVGKRKAKVTT